MKLADTKVLVLFLFFSKGTGPYLASLKHTDAYVFMNINGNR